MHRTPNKRPIVLRRETILVLALVRGGGDFPYLTTLPQPVPPVPKFGGSR